MTKPASITALIDIRDDVTVAKNFVALVYMACQAGLQAGGERAALCEVANAAREKLEGISTALDGLIKGLVNLTPISEQGDR